MNLTRHGNTRFLMATAMLIAMASVLHIIEGLLTALPHGFKLGLANVVTIATIAIFGPRAALTVAVGRTLIGSLYGPGIISVGFAMSFSGALASWAVMSGLYKFFQKHLSLVGISVVGSVFHILAQLLVASLILEDIAVYSLAPLMMAFSIPTGIMVGLVAGFLIRSLAKIPNFFKG
ncbi:MAG: Gx transporter family protein [Bacillota bacterium]